MERPNFQNSGILRDFSKETAPDKRTEVAAQIREIRNTERAEAMQTATPESALNSKLDELNISGEQETTDLLRLGEIRDQVGIPRENSPRESKAREALKKFYDDEADRFVAEGITKEQITETFSAENLARMNLDDYILLLRRFPDELATHVTRTGVRDHSQNPFHQAGLGKISTGTTSIFNEGTLHSVMSKYLVKENKIEAIGEYLKDIIAQMKPDERYADVADRRLAEMQLRSLTDRNAAMQAGGIDDNVSVHLATGAVLDKFYGAETGNECFFAFPKAFLLSNFYFQHEQGHGQDIKNNLWIHAENGLPINTSIVFLPEKALVDAETGSRYKLENGEPVIDVESTGVMMDLLLNPQTAGLLIELQAAVASGGDADEIFNKLAEISPIANDENFKLALTDPALLNDVVYCLKKDQGLLEYHVARLAESAGMKYARAENTVSSKEYWERYFEEHPQLKPNKLVYYSGDPTAAMNEWKEMNGIATKGRENARLKSIHFGENDSVGYGGAESFYQLHEERRQAFRQIAQESIDKIF